MTMQTVFLYCLNYITLNLNNIYVYINIISQLVLAETLPKVKKPSEGGRCRSKSTERFMSHLPKVLHDISITIVRKGSVL
jgi:hypothetical protein